MLRISYFVILVVGVSLFFTTNSAFADTTIKTANTDLAAPGCLGTSVGCYTPSPAYVSVGDVVTMTNADSGGIHTFTAGTVDGFAASPSGVFDSGILMAGDSFSYIANTAGENPYYFKLQVWMEGLVIVNEGNETKPKTNPTTISVLTDRVSY